MSWKLVYTKQAQKDAKKAARAGFKTRMKELLAVVAQDPFASPLPFEKLVGDLAGAYSRRINIYHRLIYQILPEAQVVKVLRMWTHYTK